LHPWATIEGRVLASRRASPRADDKGSHDRAFRPDPRATIVELHAHPRSMGVGQRPSATSATTGAELAMTTPHRDLNAPTTDALRLAAARAELADACDGWRLRHRCVDADGTQLRDPHPECLAVQYRYVLVLIEHGLVSPRARPGSPDRV
jgi:hypothetical protein